MAEKLKCLIVEDELMSRKSLSALCEKMEHIHLEAGFESAQEALSYLQKNTVDLIFLDIEMPEMTGLQLLDQLIITPQIIFTTSHKDYAFEAFEYDVTDFLVKPITPKRFQKAVEKALKRKELLDAVAMASARHEIYIKTEGKYIRLAYTSILYFENLGDYIKVISEKGTYIIHGSMKSLDMKIQHPRFLKVHRSYIVNLEKIVDIQDNSLVIQDTVIPISRAHKAVLMKSINII